MRSPDRAVAVVFNGAVYNFRALRAELESRGYGFESETDTEVLVHGYREWGADGLVERLRGMFAFALWDARARKLFLVRDRLGVKPLLYARRGPRLAFASTARALRAGGFAGEVDERAFAEFLEYGFVTDARSVYRGVEKVPAASVVEWSGGELRTREYWTPPAASPVPSMSFAEAVDETERLFLRAVERRLQADVPVGALLSGGVDSSLVCWAIAHLGGGIKAFTVGTPGDPWDETEDARATAQALGLDHRVIEMSADESPDIDVLTEAYGEPFACASALGMLRVSKAVAPSAKVLLTGDGGDDVFLGYPEHRHFWLSQRLARTLPAAAPAGWQAVRGAFPRRGPLRRAASFLDYASGGLGAVAAAHDGLPFYQRGGLLGERLAGVGVEQRGLPWSANSARGLLAEFLAYDRRMRFVGEYLTKVDGATMHYGIEARSPFLDQELWEFAAALPFEVRLRRGRLKAVLRELARRRIGERVARGRKRGFGVPVGRWLVGRWRAGFEELLRDSVLDREGWISAENCLTQLGLAARAGEAPKQLWYVYVLESWMRRERLHDGGPALDEGERPAVAAAVGEAG
jgi:asparagine synthase (glutamine-hydrolysing)